MPRTLFTTSLVLLAFGLAACRTAPVSAVPFADGRPRPRWVAERRAITLDGRLDDWQGIRFYPVTRTTGVFDLESAVTHSHDDLHYRFAVCHDGAALYVAVEVTDDRLQLDDTTPGETHAKAWWDDAVEVFIDGNHNRAPNARLADGSEYASGGEFSLVANGAATSQCTAWPDSFGKPEFWQGATSSEQRADHVILRYEVRLTWAVMGGNAGPGTTIGFTLGVQDDDDGGDRDHALYIVGITPHCWKDENGWGDVFVKP